MRSKEKQYYIDELIKFKCKIGNEDIDFSFEDISEVSKIHTSISETVSYIVDLEKEIERIKSVDIYKLVEDADIGQLLHKDKIRNKIKELLKIDTHNDKTHKAMINFTVLVLKGLEGE